VGFLLNIEPCTRPWARKHPNATQVCGAGPETLTGWQPEFLVDRYILGEEKFDLLCDTSTLLSCVIRIRLFHKVGRNITGSELRGYLVINSAAD
jgi:hypothetical protein